MADESTTNKMKNPIPGPINPIVVEPQEPEIQPFSMWQSVCLIIQAVASNIRDADIVEMTNMFRMAFRSLLATIIVTGFGYLLYEIAMVPESEESKLNRFVGVILGYVAGVLTMAVGFYFGGQDRTKKPDERQPLQIPEGDVIVPFNEGGTK